MSKTTNWIAAANTDFNNAANWSNGVPVSGDTVQFLDSMKPKPASNLPNSGQVFAVVFCDSVGSGWGNANDTTFLGTGSWSYSALTIGSTSQHGDYIYVTRDTTAGGTITICGIARIYAALANATLTVASGGTPSLRFTGTVSQPVTVAAGGQLYAYWNTTIIFQQPISLGGLLTGDGQSGEVWNCTVNATGNGAAINWTNGGLTLNGGINANGYTITYSNTGGATLTCNQASSTLDLGADTPSLNVTIAATAVSMNRNLTCNTLNLASGSLYKHAFTITYSTLLTGTGLIVHDWRFKSAALNPVVLAAAQPNYAPAVAGNQMDLVNAPNATAVTAIQSGLATATALSDVATSASSAASSASTAATPATTAASAASSAASAASAAASSAANAVANTEGVPAFIVAATDALESIESAVGTSPNARSITWTQTDANSQPVAGATVWTTSSGSDPTALTSTGTALTNAAGVAKLTTLTGVQYVWRMKAGYTFANNPTRIEVT